MSDCFDLDEEEDKSYTIYGLPSLILCPWIYPLNCWSCPLRVTPLFAPIKPPKSIVNIFKSNHYVKEDMIGRFIFAFSHNNRNITSKAVASLLCPLKKKTEVVLILCIKYLLKKNIKSKFINQKVSPTLLITFFYLFFSFLLHLKG